MNGDRIIWFGRYEGWLRLLAHGVKDGDADCIRKAARLFDLMLPDQCVVVPMPGHAGRADRMLAVAQELISLRPGERIALDALECDPHEPSYSQKARGLSPSPIRMRRTLRFPARGRGVFVIDNVVASGATASAALAAIPEARVLTLARS